MGLTKKYFKEQEQPKPQGISYLEREGEGREREIGLVQA